MSAAVNGLSKEDSPMLRLTMPRSSLPSKFPSDGSSATDTHRTLIRVFIPKGGVEPARSFEQQILSLPTSLSI